jgi:hypothetical protein
MTEKHFDAIVLSTIDTLKELLITKGREYRRNDNPLHNFEAAARKKGITREQALDGFLLKHEVSIDDIVDDMSKGTFPSREAVEEKMNDILVYNLIKKASILDRLNEN